MKYTEIIDEAIPYSWLQRAKTLGKKWLTPSSDSRAAAAGKNDLQKSANKSKKIISQWMQRQGKDSLSSNEIKNSGLVGTPALWDQAVTNARVTNSNAQLTDSQLNQVLVEYLKLLYQYQSTNPPQSSSLAQPTPSNIPSAADDSNPDFYRVWSQKGDTPWQKEPVGKVTIPSSGSTSTGAPPLSTPYDFETLKNFIQTRMDPNQARLMLKNIGVTSENQLLERGEFKTNKLVAVYRKLTPEQQKIISAELQKKATKAKASATSAAPAAPAAPTSNSTVKIPSGLVIDWGGDEYIWKGNQWLKKTTAGKWNAFSGHKEMKPKLDKAAKEHLSSLKEHLQEKYQKFLKET